MQEVQESGMKQRKKSAALNSELNITDKVITETHSLKNQI